MRALDKRKIRVAVAEALEELVESQPELFERGVTERTVCHHLANYIAPRIGAGFKVDVEYNRHIEEQKTLLLPSRTGRGKKLRDKRVFPEIIVHRRGTDRQNVLVIEMKRRGRSKRFDAVKLRAFRDQYGYRDAAQVTIGVNRSGAPYAEVEWLVG